MGQDREEMEEEEEYVLLDLDSVSTDIDIPQNAPYVISGLDTLNPILIIDNKIKLIGEYEETIGTCIIFNESEVAPITHEEMGPSETNLLSNKRIMDPKETPAKQVNPLASLQKVLKFRLFLDADDGNGEDKVQAHYLDFLKKKTTRYWSFFTLKLRYRNFFKESYQDQHKSIYVEE